MHGSEEGGPAGPAFAVVEAGLEMPLREAMETQRSVRRLRPDAVDDAIVLRCLELATRAPTGGNAQNWEFVIVKDAGLKEQLARQYRQVWRLYGRVARRVVKRRGDEGSRRILAAVEWQVQHFAEVPVLVVACLRGPRVPFLARLPVVSSSFYGSIYPSVQNLLLAARTMGLGGALVTLPLWSTRRARTILGLPRTVTPCCVVPLGWPRGGYGPTSRKPVGTVVHLDRYGNQPWKESAG